MAFMIGLGWLVGGCLGVFAILGAVALAVETWATWPRAMKGGR
jgi:hypothetical protein